MLEVIDPSIALKKLLAANDTTNSGFAARAPTTTDPVNNAGIINLAGGSQHVHQQVQFCPYGIGNADETFTMRFLGWKKVSTLWVPIPLGDLTLTVSTAVGVAGSDVLNTERFADTIATLLDLGNFKICSNAANYPAVVEVKTLGALYMEVLFNRGTLATSMNTLFSRR